MKSILEIGEIKGKNVLVRVDFNVPIKNGKIIDSSRIEASLATILFLKKKGARVILIAHLGKENESLLPVVKYLNKKTATELIECNLVTENCRGKIDSFDIKTLLVLENIRRYSEEEKNSLSLAKALASLGDYYVNDAFSVSHRAHASVVGVPKLLPHFAGIQMLKEVETLTKVFENPQYPFLFILGGAKFGTKIPLIKRFSKIASEIVIAGAIVNSFLKTSGLEVGKSVVDDGYEEEIKKILNKENLLLPIDLLVQRGEASLVLLPYEVKKNDVIVDIGPQTVSLIKEKIKLAKMIVWNGPTGWYENGYKKATEDLAKSIVLSKANSIIGGGDTGALVDKIARGKKNIFVSTGGGATLEFLSVGTLVGIEVLNK